MRRKSKTEDGRRKVVVGLTLALLLGACAAGLSPGGAWRDSEGNEVSSDAIWSFRGEPAHCGFGSATFLFIGRAEPLTNVPENLYDQYIRDPGRLFTDLLADSFAFEVEPPADAEFSGYATPRLRLWYSPTIDTAVFIEVTDRFERWPRVAGESPVMCA